MKKQELTEMRKLKYTKNARQCQGQRVRRRKNWSDGFGVWYVEEPKGGIMVLTDTEPETVLVFETMQGAETAIRYSLGHLPPDAAPRFISFDDMAEWKEGLKAQGLEEVALCIRINDEGVQLVRPIQRGRPHEATPF